MKKAQSTVEFLITYGWAILIALIAVGFLTQFGILHTSACKHFIGFHAGFGKFYVIDHKVTGTDSPVANTFYMKIFSKTKEDFVVKKVKVYKDEQLCGESVEGASMVNDEVYTIVVGGPLIDDCVETQGMCYKFDTQLVYSRVGSPLEHTDRGQMIGAFDSEKSHSFTPWTRTDFSGEVSKEESWSLIGAYEDVCPGITPSDTSGFVPVTGTIYWDLPREGRCYAGDAANKGFANAHCLINIRYLSHGWVTTNLTVNNIIQDKDFYLIGSAGYIDEYGVPRNYGVCINDNLYFYVNGNLVGMGGTTGIQSNDNVLDAGEEVLMNCGGCGDIDSSAWCIPPIKLTTAAANFKYDEPNEIMVLVEDFCFPTGYTHAGGLQPFSFYFT